MDLFPGFARKQVQLGDIEINAVYGGSGPPLLLLHGFPQTHVIWHRMAQQLAERFTVVATDLRGYGDSSKPPGLPDHSNYSKRAMALDQVGVMRALGFESFFVAAHDRGARVAHRMALDHPERVKKLALLDISPTKTMYEQTDMAFARAYFHWFFLIQPAPFPETLIGSNAEFFLRTAFSHGGGGKNPTAPEAWEEYLRCFRNPATIHANCEEYRAAAGIDLEHSQIDDAAGNKVHCPLLVLWGQDGVIARYFDPLNDWAAVASDVRGCVLPGGHFMPEEEPERVLAELTDFFTA